MTSIRYIPQANLFGMSRSLAPFFIVSYYKKNGARLLGHIVLGLDTVEHFTGRLLRTARCSVSQSGSSVGNPVFLRDTYIPGISICYLP